MRAQQFTGMIAEFSHLLPLLRGRVNAGLEWSNSISRSTIYRHDCRVQPFASPAKGWSDQFAEGFDLGCDAVGAAFAVNQDGMEAGVAGTFKIGVHFIANVASLVGGNAAQA